MKINEYFKSRNIASYWPHLVIITTTVLLFRKFFLDSLLPIPSDLLVSFFFPWFSGGWQGYDSWTTSKEFLSSDAIRQIIPWKHLALEQLRQGQIPLWNPHNFAGTPLLANLQSSVFYPGNFLFIILPFSLAWSGYIMIQPLLLLTFVYQYLKQIKLSKPAAIFGAISFAFSSFVLAWLETGVVVHTLLWLPFILLYIEKLHSRPKYRYLLAIILGSSFSILAGHSQSFINVLIVASLYWLARTQNYHGVKLHLKKSILLLFVWLAATVGLTAIQLIPSIQLKNLSPLSEPFAFTIFQELKTPWKHFATFLAPDFFGHPASENFWSEIYGDGTPFFGIAALFLSSLTIYQLKNWRTKFFWTIFTIFLFYSFPGPVYKIVELTQLPLFSQTLAARSFFVVLIAGSFLAAIGLDFLLVNFKKPALRTKAIYHLVFIALIFAGLWFFVLASPQFLTPKQTWANNLQVSKRNLILPSVVFASLVLSTIILLLKKNKTLFILGISIPMIAFGFFRANKTLPFSRQEFFFPKHPLIEKVSKLATYDRYTGTGTAKFEKNFSSYYGLFASEGYDSLRIRRYAELLSTQTSTISAGLYSKSDSDFLDIKHGNTRRLMDLMAVRYIIDVDDLDVGWKPRPEKFQDDRVQLIWQKGKFKIYQRPTSLDRFFIVNNYVLETNKDEILKAIYNPETDLTKTIILEQEPTIPIVKSEDAPSASSAIEEVGRSEILKYTPSQVDINVNVNQNSLLFLSDAHYPGWEAYVDGTKTPILRANYAFRAVPIATGSKTVALRYEPKSFQQGTQVSLATAITLLASSVYLFKSKRTIL